MLRSIRQLPNRVGITQYLKASVNVLFEPEFDRSTVSHFVFRPENQQMIQSASDLLKEIREQYENAIKAKDNSHNSLLSKHHRTLEHVRSLFIHSLLPLNNAFLKWCASFSNPVSPQKILRPLHPVIYLNTQLKRYEIELLRPNTYSEVIVRPSLGPKAELFFEQPDWFKPNKVDLISNSFNTSPNDQVESETTLRKRGQSYIVTHKRILSKRVLLPPTYTKAQIATFKDRIKALK